MANSEELSHIREKLIQMRALADNARSNNQKIVSSIVDKLESIDDSMLETLEKNGFDVKWVKSINFDKLGDPEYMRELKRKNVQSIGQISDFLEKYLVD